MTAPALRVEPHEIPALFDRLCQHYPAREEQVRDGVTWVHVPCPRCGKDSSRRDIHFSFSSTGKAKCFSCGYGANLKQLAARLEVEIPAEPLPQRPRPEPAIKRYRWMDELPEYLRLYTASPMRYELWNLYRGLSPEIVDRYQLGSGYFPRGSSQCDHSRLMVPMLQNGAPVAFRGRECDSDCHHPKWLTTAMGNRPPLLYNGAVLLPEKDRVLVSQFDTTDSLGPYVRGRVLVVVENPVDCLLLESVGISAVACLGVTMWGADRPWTALVRQAKPSRVIVWFDHDLPGNGAASPAEYARMVEDWKARHGDHEPPLSNGLKLANMLNESGVPAACFRWPESAPLKADPGWLIERVGTARLHDICHL